MSDTTEEKIQATFDSLNEKITNIPHLDFKNIKTNVPEDIIDDVDMSSIIGIGLTLIITTMFLWHYRV